MNQSQLTFDVLIIGGGPAGLAAALAAKEQGAEKVAIFERSNELGGILQQCIHNGFGLHRFKEELTGPEYAARFMEEVEAKDIDVYLNTMVISLTKERRVTAVSSGAWINRVRCQSRCAGDGLSGKGREVRLTFLVFVLRECSPQERPNALLTSTAICLEKM